MFAIAKKQKTTTTDIVQINNNKLKKFTIS